MLLGKSCKKEFNIKVTQKIKIGTLFEYRECENQEIADLDEGKLTFTLNFDGAVTVDRRWVNTMLCGAVHLEDVEDERRFGTPGTYAIDVIKLNIIQEGRLVILQDSVLKIQRESLNSFIFCMSLVRKTADCIGMFSGYDDYWYLSATPQRIDFFGRTIGNALLDAVIKEHSQGNYLIAEDAPLEELEIFVAYATINYSDRTTHISNESIVTLDEYMSKLDNMAFTKPSDPFAKEKEFRFQYVIIDNAGKIYPPLVKSLLIDAHELLPIIF